MVPSIRVQKIRSYQKDATGPLAEYAVKKYNSRRFISAQDRSYEGVAGEGKTPFSF
jgi:hypothetical protein